MRKTLLIAVLALVAACSRDIQNSEAVRQGVLDYLTERKTQTGLDPAQMQIDIASVSFQKDEARATVMFRPKNSPDPTPMTIPYLLDRKGNQWVVRPHGQGGGNPHGGGGGEGTAPEALPPGHPAIPNQGPKQ